MIGAGKLYSKMRDSGAEGLGKVPEHWDVRRLGQIGTFSKGSGGNKDDEAQEGVPCIRYGDLYTTHKYFIRASRSCLPPGRAADYTLLRFGDLLFAASGESMDEIGKPAVNLLRSEARCGGDIVVFRAKREMDAEFLGYAADSPSAIVQKAMMGRGFTVMHIYAQQLKRLAVPVPSLAEQAQIARFLDHANDRIQRYIRAKEKLIALLEEQKQAVIHQAVTGQIDVRTGLRYPAYKHSGAKWLGEVPAHWDVVMIGAMSKLIQTGPFGSQLHSREYVTFGTPVINPSHMEAGRLKSSATVTVGSEKAHELSRHKFRAGDIAIARRGELGRCALVTPAEAGWICGTGSLLLRCRASVIPEFFQVVFSSQGVADMLSFSSVGSTMSNLSAGVVARQRLALPSFGEQQRIVHSIREEADRVNCAISRLEHEIELLLEYRTRLIADVVTGKLDVREAASALPEKPRTQSTALDHVDGGAADQ